MHQITRPTRRLTRGLAAGALATTALVGGTVLATTATAMAGTASTAQDEQGTERTQPTMKQLIDRMTGTWMVDLSVSKRHLDRMRQMQQGGALASPERRMREDRPGQAGGGTGNEAGSGGEDRSASGETQDEMVKMSGFATISSMMGDTMMRERFFTDDPRLMPGMHRKADQPADGSSDAKLAGIAWLDLDEDAGEYSAVFIGNGTDRIHHAVGRLNRDGRRVTFRHSRMLDNDRRMPMHTPGPVVLEWMEDGSFSVTMYRGRGMRMERGMGMGREGDANAGARGRRAPGALTDDSTRTAAGQATGDQAQDRDRDRDRDRDMKGMNREDIVYRAIYTRTMGEEKRKLDQRIQRIVSSMK